MICPSCLKETQTVSAKAGYCPFCGAKLTSDELAESISRADEESDYAKKRELLIKALERFPGAFELEKRLLYIGRLWEKGGKADFYRIPFWPLSALDKPGEFTKSKRREMLGRFLDNKDLGRVKALSGAPEAFEAEYYTRMAECYMEWFIRDTQSVSAVAFFKRCEKSKNEVCRQRVAGMLNNLEKCHFVPEDKKPVLAKAIADAGRRLFEIDI